MKKILFIIFNAIFHIRFRVSKIIKRMWRIPRFVRIYSGWCIAAFLMLLCACVYILCAYNAVLLAEYTDRSKVIIEYVGNAALGICVSIIVAIGLQISMNNSKKRQHNMIIWSIDWINVCLKAAVKIPNKIVFNSNNGNNKTFDNSCSLALPILENDEEKRKNFYIMCKRISKYAFRSIYDMKMMDSDEWKYISELYGYNPDYIRKTVILFETMRDFSYGDENIKNDFLQFQDRINACFEYNIEFNNDFLIQRYYRNSDYY